MAAMLAAGGGHEDFWSVCMYIGVQGSSVKLRLT